MSCRVQEMEAVSRFGGGKCKHRKGGRDGTVKEAGRKAVKAAEKIPDTKNFVVLKAHTWRVQRTLDGKMRRLRKT